MYWKGNKDAISQVMITNTSYILVYVCYVVYVNKYVCMYKSDYQLKVASTVDAASVSL